jgi:hypothetical protein
MSSQAAHISGQAFIQRTITNSPRSASRDGKKLVHRFMVGKPKIAPRSRSAKIPPVSITLRRRGQTFYYIPIPWGRETEHEPFIAMRRLFLRTWIAGEALQRKILILYNYHRDTSHTYNVTMLTNDTVHIMTPLVS